LFHLSVACLLLEQVPFTIQSGGKPANYALAVNDLGSEEVHRYVGHEPSGESFNCIKLSLENKPHNPLINAGAIVVSSLIK
jgi:glutaminase